MLLWFRLTAVLTSLVGLVVVACADNMTRTGTAYSGQVDGVAWSVAIKYDERNDLVCFERRSDGEATGHCVPPVPDAQVIDVVGARGNGLPAEVITGQVASSVSEVRVEMADGEVVVLELRSLSGTDRKVFAAAMGDRREPQLIEAETRDGKLRQVGL